MIRRLADRFRRYMLAPVLAAPGASKGRKEGQRAQGPGDPAASPGAVAQKTLSAAWRQLYATGVSALAFKDVGFRVHSQHEEDGLLLFLFTLLGVTNKRSVEICAGNGIVCNTANLILNHRWIGLLCDGNPAMVERARRFYARHPDTSHWPPAIVHAWITRGNVNELIAQQGFHGDIDLLSLDIDGNDYWIWEALTCVQPRVVVLEFNHLCGPEASISVPYRDDFVAEMTQHGSDYAGASLGAFVKLGRRKGYRLVGVNAIATNAFFVRDDLHCAWLPEIDAATCFDHPRAQFGMQQRWPAVKDKPWVEV